MSDAVATEYDIYRNVESADPAESMFVNDIDTVPSDDDTDYPILNLDVVAEHGLSFRPVDVADRWLQPLNDRVDTGVAGTSPERISTLADRTLDLACDQP